MQDTQPSKTEIIRSLNDAFRKHQSGNGRIMITHGIQVLGQTAMQKICKRVTEFDQFNKDNDPYGEHDFGAIDYETKRIFWKMDYYDLSLKCGSEDPSNSEITAKVLTIMLAEEY